MISEVSGHAAECSIQVGNFAAKVHVHSIFHAETSLPAPDTSRLRCARRQVPGANVDRVRLAHCATPEKHVCGVADLRANSPAM